MSALKKGRKQEIAELEAELLRLNELVRARRKQLARLRTCRQKDCECRMVWQEVVQRKLAGQMGKIRRKVSSTGSAKKGKPSAAL